jgi:hypothetical protein
MAAGYDVYVARLDDANSDFEGVAMVSAQNMDEAEELVRKIHDNCDYSAIEIVSIQRSHSLTCTARSARLLEWFPLLREIAESRGQW